MKNATQSSLDVLKNKVIPESLSRESSTNVVNLIGNKSLFTNNQQRCVEDPRQKPSGMTSNGTTATAHGFTIAPVTPTPAQKHCGAGSAEAANCAGYSAQKQNGFTLIELLVVVLIIGILAAVALPQYQKAVTKARFAEALTNLKTIAEAHKVCYMEKGDSCSFDDLSVDIGIETGANEYIGGYSSRLTENFAYSVGITNACSAANDTWVYTQYLKEDVCLCYMQTGEIVVGISSQCAGDEPHFDYAKLLNLPSSEDCCCC